MDIKGMNKDAAYNSLIAASQAINESGDFKGDIKSGKLINQIIQATSKQFDKPKATKDAIDTLILKGEIEKDIKASDPAAKLAAELTGKRIALADKQLAGESLFKIQLMLSMQKLVRFLQAADLQVWHVLKVLMLKMLLNQKTLIIS
jgi:hypothetical protein